MTDIVSREVRSRMMSGIRGKDTRPELFVRQALHRQGFRFRLHARGLRGVPDLVLPKYHVVVFIHGCFWHRHECHLFRWPGTRKRFWSKKIGANAERDHRNNLLLRKEGWRVAIVWECSLRGCSAVETEFVIERLATWIQKGKTVFWQTPKRTAKSESSRSS
jgi:DNA mismatch endonuclease, patch repair protein